MGAFEDLVHGYSARVRWWAGGILRDPSEIEDVIQEVLSSAWRAAPGLRPDTVLAPWLKTVTLNAARKRLRSYHGGVASLELVPDHPGEVIEPELDERVDVYAALGRLPDRESQILQLLYLDSLTMQEAASTLGVSEEAAKSLAARARRRFRKMFREWFSAASSFAVAPLRWLGQLPEIVGNAGGAAGFAAGTAIALAVAVAPPSVPPAQPSTDGSTATGDDTQAFRALLGLPEDAAAPGVPAGDVHPRRQDPPGGPVRAGDPAGPPEGRPQGPPAPPPGQGGEQPPGQAKSEPPGQAKSEPPGQAKSEPPGQAKADPPGQGSGSPGQGNGPPAPPPGQGGEQPPGQAKDGSPGQGNQGPPPSQGGQGQPSDPPGKGPQGSPGDGKSAGPPSGGTNPGDGGGNASPPGQGSPGNGSSGKGPSGKAGGPKA